MKYPNTLEEQPIFNQGFSPQRDWTNRTSRRKAIKKRKRKSSDQLRMLSQEFKACSEWDKDMMSRLAKKTGLSEAQIYKWSWDQKKKSQVHDKLKMNKSIHLSEIFNKLPEIFHFSGPREKFCIDTKALGCSEVVVPRSLDYEMYDIQRNYRLGAESLSQIKASSGCLDNFLDEFPSFYK